MGSSVAKHHFPASQRSTGVYFADQPTEMWTDCSQGTVCLKLMYITEDTCEAKSTSFIFIFYCSVRNAAVVARV